MNNLLERKIMKDRTVIIENGNVIVTPPPEKVGDSIRGCRASKFIEIGDYKIQEDILGELIKALKSDTEEEIKEDQN